MKSFVAYAPALIMLWTCAAAAAAADRVTTTAADVIEGPSLAEISQIIESTGYSSPFDFFGASNDDGSLTESESFTDI